MYVDSRPAPSSLYSTATAHTHFASWIIHELSPRNSPQFPPDSSSSSPRSGRVLGFLLQRFNLWSLKWILNWPKSSQKSSFGIKVSRILAVNFENLSKDIMEGPFRLIAIWKKQVVSRRQLFLQMAAVAISQCLSFFGRISQSLSFFQANSQCNVFLFLVNFTMPFLS